MTRLLQQRRDGAFQHGQVPFDVVKMISTSTAVRAILALPSSLGAQPGLFSQYEVRTSIFDPRIRAASYGVSTKPEARRGLRVG